MNSYKLAPIILFVYNRPDHTRRTIEGLLSNPDASESNLYIFADGPQNAASVEDKKNIEEVRKYIHTITGFKKVIIEESEKNRGLANSTIYGCSKVINLFGRMIMMEDDDIPTPFFLSYVNRCLDKFEHDENIWCVSGYVDNGIIPSTENTDDLFLVNRPSSWGFGTWKRCWDKVIWDVDILKGLFSHHDLVKGYNKWGGLDSSKIMFSFFEGKSSSWSIRYNFAAYLTDSKTILPNKSLINNIGCDGSGTHCGDYQLHLKYMERDIIIPEHIQFDKNKNRQLWSSFRPSLKEKLLEPLNKFPSLKKWLKDFIQQFNIDHQ